MAVSGFGLRGFTEGLVGGMQAGRQIDDWKWQDKQRARQEERWDQQDEMAELNQTLQEYQLEELKDKRFREQYQRNAQFLRYTMDQATNPETAEEWQQRVQSSPELQRELYSAWQFVSDPIVNRGGPDGSRKRLAGFAPTEDGRLVPEVEVTREDGTSYVAPMTENRGDDPDDAVTAFSPGEIASWLAETEGLAEIVDAMAVRYGDTTPIERQQAEREAARERQQAEREHERGLDTLREEYRLKGDLEATKAQYGTADNQPARVRTVEWIAQNLTDGDMDRAWKLAEGSDQDLALEIYKAEREAASENQFVDPPSEEEIWRRVDSVMERLKQNDPMRDPSENDPMGIR